MLNKKCYDEHPIPHHYPKHLINVQPIQVANDQLMTVKEAIKFLVSFGGHAFEIIAYLLPFSTAFDFIFGLQTMTGIEGKSNYSKLEFKFKKRSIGITPSKDIHLPVGKTTAIDFEMVRNPPGPFRLYSSSENEITDRRLSTSNIESCSSEWQNTYECHKYWLGRITSLQGSAHWNS